MLVAAGADADRLDDAGKRPADMAFERPKPIDLAVDALGEYVGLYDLGGGFTIKIWREENGLRLVEFAPDDLDPIGPDVFLCRQEPWRVRFVRDASGGIEAVEVDFLRRTVRGDRLDHPQYVGSARCAKCHLDPEHGNQYVQWLSSRHALAYWRLATQWATFLAGQRALYEDVEDPIQDDRCLLCHVTGAQDPNALHAGSFSREEGVGCEACHGPGSAYVDPEIMGDRKRFTAAGGVVPDERTCRGCHRDDRFDFAVWWSRLEHARPAPDAHGR